MRDVHVHFLHGNPVGYSKEYLDGFIMAAQKARLDEMKSGFGHCISGIDRKIHIRRLLHGFHAMR